MRSFMDVAWVAVLSGCGRGSQVRDVEGRLLDTSAPAIPVVTPAPSIPHFRSSKHNGPDAVSLAEFLLTVVPVSLQEIAATNIPAVAHIIWAEFLDGKRPEWFEALPPDIQSYLVAEFGPLSTRSPEVTATSTESNRSASLTATSGTTGVHESTAISRSRSATSSESELPQSTRDVTHGSTSLTASMTLATSASSPIEPTNSATNSSTLLPPAPVSSTSSGLTRSQILSLGIGLSLGILGAVALTFGFCILLRHHKRKTVDGSIPPSSPGFIPRFAFEDKSNPQDDSEKTYPPNQRSKNSLADMHSTAWGEEFIGTSSSGESVPILNRHTNPQYPIIAPPLLHTHSSNRARGKRTSYSTLHSVAEGSELDSFAESPILGHSGPPRGSRMLHNSKRYSLPRNLIPTPVLSVANSTIKRKPVSGSFQGAKAADLASRILLRQAMPEYDAETATSAPRFESSRRRSLGSTSNQFNSHTSPYASPIEEHGPNPFSNHHLSSYEEDYGPEYNLGINDRNDDWIHIDMYGGQASLLRYPKPPSERIMGARSEWPLRSKVVDGEGVSASGNVYGHRRN